MGLGALDHLIAGLLRAEMAQLRGKLLNFRCRVSVECRIPANRAQKVEMDPDQAFGMMQAETRRHRRAPITPLRTKAFIAERAHQFGGDIGHLPNAKARLTGAERQAVTWQRGRNHGEGVRRIAAKGRRIGQARDDVEKLKDRARPAVKQQQQHRLWTLAGDMERMDIDPGDGHLDLRKAVEPGLLCPPVETIAPIGDDIAQIADIGAIGPRRIRRLIGQACQREPRLQIGDLRVFDMIAEGGDGHDGRLSGMRGMNKRRALTLEESVSQYI